MSPTDMSAPIIRFRAMRPGSTRFCVCILFLLTSMVGTHSRERGVRAVRESRRCERRNTGQCGRLNPVVGQRRRGGGKYAQVKNKCGPAPRCNRSGPRHRAGARSLLVGREASVVAATAALEAQDRQSARHGRRDQRTEFARLRAVVEEAVADEMQEVLEFILRQPDGLGEQWIDARQVPVRSARAGGEGPCRHRRGPRCSAVPNRRRRGGGGSRPRGA